VDTLDAGPDDLDAIGADIDDQRDHRCGVGRQADAERRQAEEDHEDLDQERRIANQLDIGVDDDADGLRTRGLAERSGDGDDHADDHRNA
jgi:hypothetical protein